MNERIGQSELSRIIAEQTGTDQAKVDAFIREMFKSVEDELIGESLVKVDKLGLFRLIQNGPTWQVLFLGTTDSDKETPKEETADNSEYPEYEENLEVEDRESADSPEVVDEASEEVWGEDETVHEESAENNNDSELREDVAEEKESEETTLKEESDSDPSEEIAAGDNEILDVDWSDIMASVDEDIDGEDLSSTMDIEDDAINNDWSEIIASVVDEVLVDEVPEEAVVDEDNSKQEPEVEKVVDVTPEPVEKKVAKNVDKEREDRERDEWNAFQEKRYALDESYGESSSALNVKKKSLRQKFSDKKTILAAVLVVLFAVSLFYVYNVPQESSENNKNSSYSSSAAGADAIGEWFDELENKDPRNVSRVVLTNRVISLKDLSVMYYGNEMFWPYLYKMNENIVEGSDFTIPSNSIIRIPRITVDLVELKGGNLNQELQKLGEEILMSRISE